MAKSKDFILGIDTSCDETSLAIWDLRHNKVVESLISSQSSEHALYGGVVPELASRRHVENFPFLLERLLSQTRLTLLDFSKIAVTVTPGLIGCLLVGVNFAKALSWRLKIPLVPIHHLEAHLFSPFLEEKPVFPFLGLVVSGGHTAFYHVQSFSEIELLGQTVDDAAGEAFDKTAKLMGLGYPGGPMIDRLAQTGNPNAFSFTIPKVKMGEKYLSFSGIKTAVRHHLENLLNRNEKVDADLCASLQNVIVKTLVQKARYFLEKKEIKAFALSGGVAMNSLLRKKIAEFCEEKAIPCFLAKLEYCTDNAAMVAGLAVHREAVCDPFVVQTLATQKIQARRLIRS